MDGALKSADKQSTGFFSRIGKGIKAAGVGVATVATAVTAMAVKGGISRALNIENAQAKLKGLGNDTQKIETIMGNALNSVKGTAFGLGSAATVAAAAVASGIKPGRQLEGVLKTIANTAAASGTSMEEMGAVFTKVAATGRAYTDDIQQIANRGLPIWEKLSEHFGVTADEVRKMATEGKIAFADFAAAASEAGGTIADELGNTTSGAFDNMKAAFSRLGEVLVGGPLPSVKEFFKAISTIVDEFNTTVLQGVFGMSAPDWLAEDAGESIFAKWGREAAAFIREADWGKLKGGLDSIKDGFESMKPTLDVLKTTLLAAGEAFKPLLPALKDAIAQLTPAFGELVEALLPLLPPLVELVGALVPLATLILDLLIPAVVALIDWFAPMIQMVADFFGMLSGNSTMDEFVSKVGSLGGSFGAVVQSLMGVAFQFGVFIGQVIHFGQTVWGSITTVFGAVRDFFAAVWETIGLVLGGALQFIVGLVTGNVEMMRAGIAQALGAIQGLWSSVWGSVTGVVAAAWSSVSQTVSDGVIRVMSFVGGLPSQIRSAFAGAAGWLVQAGRDVIQGLISGVAGMVGNAVQAVKDVGGAMLDGIKGFLGIKSPSRVFRDEVGKMVGLGLLEGVGDEAIKGRIDRTVSHMVDIPGIDSTFGGAGPLVDSVTINGNQDSRIVSDLLFALRTTSRGGVYAR